MIDADIDRCPVLSIGLLFPDGYVLSEPCVRFALASLIYPQISGRVSEQTIRRDIRIGDVPA